MAELSCSPVGLIFPAWLCQVAAAQLSLWALLPARSSCMKQTPLSQFAASAVPQTSLAVAPLLGNSTDPSSVQALSVLFPGWMWLVERNHLCTCEPPFLDPSGYLAMSFVFSRGKELNFVLQVGYFLFFLGNGGSEGVYLLFQCCQLLLPRGEREREEVWKGRLWNTRLRSPQPGPAPPAAGRWR